MDSGQWAVDGSEWTVDIEQSSEWTVDRGRLWVDSEQWKALSGQWTVDTSKWTVDSGRLSGQL